MCWIPGYGEGVSVASVDLMRERPVWRGKMHSWAFFAAIPAGIALIVVANGLAGKVGASIYAATLLLLFGTWPRTTGSPIPSGPARSCSASTTR